jgi:hypothetical protein
LSAACERVRVQPADWSSTGFMTEEAAVRLRILQAFPAGDAFFFSLRPMTPLPLITSTARLWTSLNHIFASSTFCNPLKHIRHAYYLAQSPDQLTNSFFMFWRMQQNNKIHICGSSFFVAKLPTRCIDEIGKTFSILATTFSTFFHISFL